MTYYWWVTITYFIFSWGYMYAQPQYGPEPCLNYGGYVYSGSCHAEFLGAQ